ncbi:MAG: phosphomannomutase, partial [Nitrospirota bacterium]
MDDRVFREYDIRGVAGRELTEDFALTLGKSFGSFLRSVNPGAKWVSVGRDSRLSSRSLASNVIRGISSTGINAYDIGLCATPLQYFSLHHLDLDGGIMVTGSHNPPEYNGFKLSIGEETIFGEEIQKLKVIMKKRKWSESGQQGVVKHYDIVRAYVEFMKERFSY